MDSIFSWNNTLTLQYCLFPCTGLTTLGLYAEGGWLRDGSRSLKSVIFSLQNVTEVWSADQTWQARFRCCIVFTWSILHIIQRQLNIAIVRIKIIINKQTMPSKIHHQWGWSGGSVVCLTLQRRIHSLKFQTSYKFVSINATANLLLQKTVKYGGPTSYLV